MPRLGPGTGVAALAIALGGVRTLAAQAPPPPPPAQAAQPAPAAQPAQQLGNVITRYLVDSPQVLNLAPKQVERVRKQLARLDSTDAPLRAQWQHVAGGRSLRDLTPVERRRLGPQLQPIMQQLRTNNQAALDSVDAILTPEQQTRLAALRAEYGQRIQARRGRAGQQP
jgi:hypothetical protein